MSEEFLDTTHNTTKPFLRIVELIGQHSIKTRENMCTWIRYRERGGAHKNCDEFFGALVLANKWTELGWKGKQILVVV